jgi:hypothetical protein
MNKLKNFNNVERKEIIEKLKKYFTLPELVCPHVYRKYSESQIWSFFTTEALETLLVLREEILCKPFIINNWKNGGSYSQRGLRCNVCVLCKEKTMLEKPYMSAHALGRAFDITVSGMEAEAARKIIVDDSDKLPYPIRLEDGVNWLHVDTMDLCNGKKVTLFNA